MTAPIHCECSLIWDCHLPLSSYDDSYPIFLVHDKSLEIAAESRPKRAVASDLIHEYRRRKDVGWKDICGWKDWKDRHNKQDRHKENEDQKLPYKGEYRH